MEPSLSVCVVYRVWMWCKWINYMRDKKKKKSHLPLPFLRHIYLTQKERKMESVSTTSVNSVNMWEWAFRAKFTSAQINKDGSYNYGHNYRNHHGDHSMCPPSSHCKTTERVINQTECWIHNKSTTSQSTVNQTMWHRKSVHSSSPTKLSYPLTLQQRRHQ